MESGTVPRKLPPIGSKDEPSRISVVTGMPGRWRQSRKSKSKSFATKSIRIRMALFLTTLIVATVAVVAAATTVPPTPPPPPPPTTTVAVAANDSEVCYGWTRRNNHHHGRFSVRQLGQTSIPTSTSRSILSILRGGGIGRAGSKRPNHRSSSSSSSVRALDDEILWLEQQLRRVHDQKRALKTKLKRSNNADRSSKRVNGTEQQHQQEQEQQQQQITNDRDRRRRHQQREEERQLQRQHDEELLTRLEAERDSLLVAKLQLESLRTECETKLLSLEADLSASNGRKADIERSFRKRLAELEASLERTRVRVRVRGSTSSGGGFAPLGGGDNHNHNHNNPELTRAIENACQRAIVDFWNEAHERLRKHEAELRIRHLEELRDERRSTEAAVGKQKEKMRALARAMAVREQGLRQKQKQQQKQEQEQEQERQQQPPKKSRGRQWKPHEHDEREQERLRLKAIREEAERKSREEEERLWLELERGLKEEREKLERQRLREEDERKRCEREELERQRILRLHAKQQERERLQQQQQQQQQNQKEHGDPNAAVTAAATNHSLDGATDCEPQRSRRLDVLRGIFGSGFPWSSASATSLREQPPSRQPEPQPLPASIENYRQRVPWQPLSLPPKEVVRITSHRTTSLQPST
eukprot:jgi/Psemu1/41241/gm1.41241_g